MRTTLKQNIIAAALVGVDVGESTKPTNQNRRK
jgi:hypothetical protein